MNRLKEYYNKEIKKALKKEFDYKNINQVAKIEKISINVGLGKAREDKSLFNKVANDLFLITGQKPKICKSKKAISGFKLREGEPIALNLTLRNKRMYEFLEKLLNISLPRIRDFRGLSQKSLDKNNNFTIGIKEHIIFPEISYDKIENIYGLQISIHIKANSKKEALSLLKHLGFPIK